SIKKLIPNFYDLPEKMQQDLENHIYCKQLHCSHTYMMEEDR
ncbi:unnamed protein product, partial [marine sediment metagenome]